MRVLLVRAGVVRNWVEAASVQAVQDRVGSEYLCVADPLNGPGIGWLYDGSVFALPPGPPPPRVITLASFLRRLSRAKRNTIRTARATDANVNDAMDLLYTYREIDLDDTTIRDFVAFLRTNGNITVAEALALLA